MVQWLGVPPVEVKPEMLVLMLVHVTMVVMFHVGKSGIVMGVDWMSLHLVVWVHKFHWI
jgi:hypothetical protein